jgi:hypothetical protein
MLQIGRLYIPIYPRYSTSKISILGISIKNEPDDVTYLNMSVKNDGYDQFLQLAFHNLTELLKIGAFESYVIYQVDLYFDNGIEYKMSKIDREKYSVLL